MKILFITWDGPQVSYVEGLFLPIFAALERRGFEFSILQFTWGNNHAARDACERYGVPYRRVEVWRTGAAGAFLTALRGGKHIDEAYRECKFDALMPRSLLPALAVMRCRKAAKLPVIFDSDGLAADEKVEFANLNRRGLAYTALRWVEARTVRQANKVLVRTQEAIPILMARGGPTVTPSKFMVVTNGRDPAPFLEASRSELPRSAPRLCYIGSLGPQYEPQRMLKIAAEIRTIHPDASFTIFTRETEKAGSLIASVGLEDASWVSVRTVQPGELPNILPGFDVGFALRQHTLSMSAVAPIKIGDYLLAGVPIIGSKSIGPVERAIQSGCMLPADQKLDKIRPWISGVLQNRQEVGRRCQQLGLIDFSLDRSIEQFTSALGGLENDHGSRGQPSISRGRLH